MSLNSKTRNLQAWLNQKVLTSTKPGEVELLAVDGVYGPKTRARFFEVFRNTNAPAITRSQEEAFAIRLSAAGSKLNAPYADLARLRAIAEVEAPRGGWDNTGLLTALYERHYLYKRVMLKIPLLSDPAPGGYTIDIDNDGINDSWEKVADAAGKFGAAVAIECASWGKFQIMGAWWSKLGYDSPIDFIWQLSRAEVAHYEALVRYIERFNLLPAFRQISARPGDCQPFAKGYNGPAYAKYGYDGKIAVAFGKHYRALAHKEGI